MFSTAYGNVGSSIYYALGVTALYAGGMTPVTFAISGVIFAFTAATYAEATARFPEGTIGMQLDSFARRPLWEAGLDYDHGTGHGVGSYLSVHEGPQNISKRPVMQARQR